MLVAGYSVAAPLEIWRDDTPPVPPMHFVRAEALPDEMLAEKPAPVVANDPVALPPEATKPESLLLTAIDPDLKLTLVGEAPGNLTVSVRLSLLTAEAKLAHAFVLLVLIVAVTLVGLTGLPLEA
ncbi:MAG TPA: hypothetical protein VED63_06635, partial [Acidimicrobiales bacterium]|nr:hypothetical protein [Acidimicrobiales bacterium]